MEFLRQLAEGIVQAWQRLSLSARINLALAGAGTIIVIVIVVVYASRAQYVELYSNLGAEDSAEIQSALREEGVPYRLYDGGATIHVPVQHRSRMRVALMERQLPRAHGVAPGFEVFDQQELLASRYLQDVNYMRAIQGELQRHLNEFDFVRRSSVFIREAREELFVSAQQPSEAAVTVDLTRPVTPREVRALVGTIANYGGAHLNHKNISLTSTDGELLHEPARDEFAALATSQLEFITALESQREQKARRALEEMGVRAIVRVSADVNFSRERETEEIVEEGAPLSSMLSSTTLTTRQSLPEGPPGAMANLPDGITDAGGTETEETTEETLENFQPSTRRRETTTEPGTIQGYRVSAFIEGSYEPVLDEAGEPTGEQAYVPLDDDEIDRYQQFIAAAVGVGVTPDDITVYDHPFEIDALAEARAAMVDAEAAEFREMALVYGMNAAALVLVIVGFFLIRRLLRRATLPQPEGEPQPSKEPAASPADRKQQQIAAEVEKASQENPEAVAALLRTWITESEE